MIDALAALRIAARSLLRRPLFSIGVVATLALGLGATIVLWSIVRSVLLDPLPLPAADRIAFITREGDVSIPDGVDWRAASPSFESIALFLRDWSLDLSGAGEPERLSASVAEPELFRVLGLSPLLGRTLEAGDNLPGSDRVAVLSEGFWRRRFAADPAVVGRTLVLSDRATTIVGVMPAAADFLDDGVALWVPVATATPWALAERGTNNFDAVGRLAPGATLAGARAELKTICERLAKAFPLTNARKLVTPIPLLDFRVGRVRGTLWILFAAVALLLVLACLNTGALLLARTLARQSELGVRAALGAGARQLLAPLAAETLLLVSSAGLAGLALARAGLEALIRTAPADLPRLGRVQLDAGSALFALSATLLTALVAVAAPAVRSLRVDPARTLGGTGKGAANSPASGRGLRWLAAAQVAIATTILAAAGLLVASWAKLLHEPLGFDPAGVVTASLVLPESRYGVPAAQTRAFEAIVDRIGSLPGVEIASFVVGGPLQPSGRIGHGVLVESHPLPAGENPRGARSRLVLGRYFDALRLPILSGRGLTAADDASAERVAVVNRRFAAAFFPGQDPIGQRISWRYADNAVWMRIVGIAADVKSLSVDLPDEVAVYTPYEQRVPDWVRFGTLVVRTSAPAGTVIPALRRAVGAVDPTLPLADVSTLDERAQHSLAQRRFQTRLLGGFALAAVLLTLQGVSALVVFLVERRRYELALRSALGASRPSILRRVLVLGLRPAAAGIVVGLVAAYAARPLLATSLFGISASDPRIFAATAGLLAAAVVVVCLPLALRASRLDPAAVLHDQ